LQLPIEPITPMADRMTREEFAALVGVPGEQINQWTRQGLLDPENLGGYEELDLLRWLTIRQYAARGGSSHQLAAAIANGEIQPFLGEYLYPTSPRLSSEDAAERSGVEPEKVRELRTALGFGREALPEGWLAQLEAFKTMHRAGLSWGAIVEGARVYGDALRRLAETEIRLVHVEVHERLTAEGLSDDEVAQHIVGIQDTVVPLLDGFVQAVHHEHLLRASIEDAYLHLPASDIPAERGSVETTIVFLDVESFTELTQAQGDELAMELLTRLEGLVRTLASQHEGKLVKQIGDGLMLAFRRPADAVAFARQALEATTADVQIPPLHVGIHTGPAIYRAGDYIGATVNLAARVSAASAAGEILITDSVASQLQDRDQTEAVGARMLRGVHHPLRLYRTIQRGARIDPVCGAIVQEPPVAQLRHDGQELWFCSQECLRRFLEAPAAAT
jgi:class 3 adenylate cyclase